jgi:1,4-alpha-glucan branching enzyme
MAKDSKFHASAASSEDIYLFAEGTHERAWQWLGAHLTEQDGVSGARFALWAPSASAVAVVGDFNDWDPGEHPLQCLEDSGVWEGFVPGLGEGDLYKFQIYGRDGQSLPMKADPYAQHMQKPGETASILHGESHYAWGDEQWCGERDKRNERSEPIAIYEVHLGSWRRGDDGAYLSYRELADELVAYAVDLNFTHLQLMPVSEYPFDGSWGYQPVGMYAPTNRFGSPDDYRYFVDRCHRAGLGVLQDWVPAHFPMDPHGLGRFDGSALYEHADPRKGFHQDWNTLIYNLARGEVISYLLSNAHYWLESYHVDGLRVDAVASMLYLDYSRDDGQWVPNEQGGNENFEAIEFLRRVNERLYANHPGIMMVAEESTAWPGVCQPAEEGGLGFGYKWNMGWMNDTLSYMSREPVHRRHHHNELTFGFHYAFSENYVLPLSHDEVVHGKRSLLGRMPGDDWQRFANLRAYYGFMWTHPGKKLIFMGGEFAQEREWNHDEALDWGLLEKPRHAGIQQLVRDLNRLYRELPALHRLDCEAEGFEWLEGGDTENSVLAYQRQDGEGAELIVISNFTSMPHEDYRLGVPEEAGYRLCLNTDAGIYSGSDYPVEKSPATEAEEAHGREQSVVLSLPPLATLVYEKVLV